jgi:hypothetical protein
MAEDQYSIWYSDILALPSTCQQINDEATPVFIKALKPEGHLSRRQVQILELILRRKGGDLQPVLERPESHDD